MEEAYATALASFMGGKKVTIARACVCYGTSEKLKYIALLAENSNQTQRQMSASAANIGNKTYIQVTPVQQIRGLYV